MCTSKQIAKHLRDVFFGKNWTCSTVKDVIKNITLEQANKKVEGFNSIFTLLQHIYYYVPVQIGVLQGGPLLASDTESFILPIINTEAEWDQYKNNIFDAVEQLAVLIENLEEGKLSENFVEEKYGNYYRNLAGLIEHTHYHLGQIVFLKKMIGK